MTHMYNNVVLLERPFDMKKIIPHPILIIAAESMLHINQMGSV